MRVKKQKIYTFTGTIVVNTDLKKRQLIKYIQDSIYLDINDSADSQSLIESLALHWETLEKQKN